MAESDDGMIEVKVVTHGPSTGGKTSLLRRYVQNFFTDGFKSTIGADFLTKNVSLPEGKCLLSIYDTAGQERFHAMSKVHPMQAKADTILRPYTVVLIIMFLGVLQGRKRYSPRI
mmetsp:Transcript_2093/g.4284  ORF Transcript_2093/g.4284 Transcript_2093/m.4284 type:complete len:115 (-) Transcript_2093:1371-1715(-)